jgi:hypothetical protein
VLPVTRTVLRARRQHRAAPSVGASAKARRRASGWIGIILTDIRRLIAFRWDGRVPEGSRNTMLFVYGTFLARVTVVSGLTDALRTFASRVCDLDAAEVDQIIASIAKKLEEGGYRYKVSNAAAALAITPEEVRLAGLRRLWPADVELDATLKAAKRNRDRQYQRRRRHAAGPARGSRAWHAVGLGPRSACRGRAIPAAASPSRAPTRISSALRRIRRSPQVGGPGRGIRLSRASGHRRRPLRSAVHRAGVHPSRFEPPVDGAGEAEAAEISPKLRPGREPVELP